MGKKYIDAEKVIEELSKVPWYNREDERQAVRIVKEFSTADNQLPVNENFISRQAAIDAIERLILPQTKGETAAEEINRVAWRCAINCAEEMIGHLPSAERTGRWIEIGVLYSDTRGLFYGKMCSVCNEISDYKSHYCPNCGARMVEKVNPCDTCENAKYTNLEDDDSICRDCGVGE